MSRLIDLAGQRFGRLLVIEAAGRNRSGGVIWACSCDCGGSVAVCSDGLRHGGTDSCGCLRGERLKSAATKHGQHGTGAHTSWMSMRQRCLNPKNPAFKDYGGRGISICDQWDSFEVFFSDMGARPNGMELDRRDVNGNYEPGNCRWATQLDQHRNQRKTLYATIDGATRCLTEWLEQYPINYRTVMTRIHKMGWPLEKAITTPRLRAGRGRRAAS